MIYLVRHAHAGNKRAWDGPDRQRPLSAKGRREAAGLVEVLRADAIRTIASSPALRCRQSVEPLARQRQVDVDLDERLAVDAGAQAAIGLLLGAGRGGTLLCTHGELVGQVLARLREQGTPISADAQWSKGSTWRLDVRDGLVVHATYLPPVQADPA